MKNKEPSNFNSSDSDPGDQFADFSDRISMPDVDNMEFFRTPAMLNKNSKAWHEKEIPIRINSYNRDEGIEINIESKLINEHKLMKYPNGIWQNYPEDNKAKLLDNIAYIFTAHLPMLLKGNIRLEYNTGYPQCFSWSQQSFMRHLPLYWYYYKKRGMSVMPMLKTLLNSRAYFCDTTDVPPEFPISVDENVILPFTFGKDSFLTYHICKELKLNTILVFFNDPSFLGYEGVHKKILFDEFLKKNQNDLYFLENPMEGLRDNGDGWFGWELSLTSWALMCLPLAYKYKAGYILFSNEKSVNAFYYDDQGFKVVPEYEQAYQATEEMSLLTQAMSEGELYTSTFLQGLNDLAIVAVLKENYAKETFPYLMSCWDGSEEKRWCGKCTKCARLYLYLSAMGVNPIEEAGFEDDMFSEDKIDLYNAFGEKASGLGWDSFGLNKEEQELSFYICAKLGYKSPLVEIFKNSEAFARVEENLTTMVDEYLGLHEEHTSPLIWRTQINEIYNKALKKVRDRVFSL